MTSSKSLKSNTGLNNVVAPLSTSSKPPLPSSYPFPVTKHVVPFSEESSPGWTWKPSSLKDAMGSANSHIPAVARSEGYPTTQFSAPFSKSLA